MITFPLSGTITVDLEAAGLTHARGRSDKCAGRHDVSLASAIALDTPDLVPAGDLLPVLQALHAAAHPGGTYSWAECRERACADAWELIFGSE